MTNSLDRRQRLLEAEAVATAKAQRRADLLRYKAKKEPHPSSNGLLVEAIQDMNETIVLENVLKNLITGLTDLRTDMDSMTGKDGITTLMPVFSVVSHEDAALIAIMEVYRATRYVRFRDLHSIASLGEQIGKDIEHLFTRTLFEDTTLGAKVIENMEANRPVWQSTAQAFGKLMTNSKRLVFETPDWTLEERIKVGECLYQLVFDHAKVLIGESYLPLFTKQLVSDNHTQKYKVVLNPPVAEKMGTLAETWINQASSYPICVIKPAPTLGADNSWTPYLTLPATMIKQSFLGAHGSDDLSSLNTLSDKTRRSIDALASTPWQINRGVMSVAQAFFSEATTLDLGQSKANVPVGTATGSRRDISRNAQRRASYARILASSVEHQSDDALYFPHSVDFRTRAYPLPTGLTPQGQDLAKGLLRFKDKVKLGISGWFWLQVHTSNSFGNDSGDLASRVQWCVDNHEQIMDSAANPYTCDFWWTGDSEDSPWQALAAAQEYAAAIRSGCPEEYLSDLPVGVDGTCNGIQHHAAATRCIESGALVALTDNPDGEDLYTTMADYLEANRQIDQRKWEVHTAGVTDLTEYKHLPDGGRRYCMNASWWAGRMSRKIAKLPTMTKPYGISDYGIAEQVKAKLLDLNMVDLKDEDHRLGTIALYFVSLANDTMEELLPGPSESMEFLQGLTRGLAKKNESLIWTTPAGDTIEMRYPKTKSNNIRCLNRQVRVKEVADNHRVDRDKMVNSSSANWVHSRDAAHLHLTVNRCLDAGITSFAMVHDSFGCHAGHVETMGRLLREEFVAMYEGNVFEELIDQIASYTTPPRVTQPSLGTLNVADVLTSERFFA